MGTYVRRKFNTAAIIDGLREKDYDYNYGYQ